jgi:hypothetical protein
MQLKTNKSRVVVAKAATISKLLPFGVASSRLQTAPHKSKALAELIENFDKLLIC